MFFGRRATRLRDSCSPVCGGLAFQILLPDLYDTDYSSYGIGVWSLMSLGTWNATTGKPLGSSPSMLDAWSKWAEGWLKPVQRQGAVTVPNAEKNPSVVQLLANAGGVDWTMTSPGAREYFLVENRQRIDYDAGLPGCGILIWHIDESRPDNEVDGGRLVELVQADGSRNLDQPWGSAAGNAGDAGDPFVGGSHQASFTRATTPSSGLYGGKPSGASVTSISAPCGRGPATMVVKVSNPGTAGGS